MLLVVTALGTMVAASVASAQPEEKIVFSSNRDVNYDIHIMDVDEGNLKQLTNDSRANTHPSLSPDGTKIVFGSNRDGQQNGGQTEIYIMDADGSNRVNLTNNLAYDYHPNWSPDGSAIAYTFNSDVYISSLDGSATRNITNTPSNFEMTVSWGPRSVPVLDTDGDGVTDGMDNCPNESGPESNAGCPLPPPDEVAPTGTVVINGGAKKTETRNVVLTLSASDAEPGSGVAEMRIKNSDEDWSEWLPYATTKDWILSAGQGKKGQGKKTVYVQYRDAASNISASASDAIVYLHEED